MALLKGKTEKKTRQTLDMTKGNPYPLILLFAWPVFLSQLFQQLYNTADTLIVGHFLGTEALAAVSSSGNLIFLMISFFEGMFLGAGILISRYFGAGNRERVSLAIHTDLAFGLFTGVLLTVVGAIFCPTFLTWMHTDPEVMPQAVSYFRFFFAGSVPMVLYNVCRGIMNALGDSRRPLYYLILSSVVNVVLDVFFIGVLHWGVAWAAIATVIAQTLSCVLAMGHLLQKGQIYTVEIKKIRIHWNMFREIVRYGFPSAIQNSVIGIANVVVQTQINTFGKIAMAAYGTHSKLEGFAFLPVTSFCMAATTFVSQNLGAREYERAKKGARFSIIMGAILAESIGLLYYAFAPALIALFDKNPGVIQWGVRQARIATRFFCLCAFSHVTAAVCRGSGKAFVPMLVMLICWCVIRLMYIMAVMKIFHDLVYIYWAYPITWALSSVIFLIYYLFSDWVHGFEKGQVA